MDQYMNHILDAINIFSNIEVATIDKDYKVDNISYHISCPKPVIEAYIRFFSDVLLKYDLEAYNIYYFSTNFNIYFYLINSEHLDKKYILGPFLTEHYKEKELKEIIVNNFGNEDIRSHINYFRMLPVVSSIQRHKLESLLHDVTLLNIHETDLNECKLKKEAPFVDAIAAYRTGVAQDVDQRYKIENGVLDCIRFGRPELLQNLGQYILHKTDMLNTSDRLRNIKNLSLSGNTLFRKAAEQGGVPPILLDKTSRDFAVKIEHTYSIEDLENLQYEMIFAYCKLVQQEKLSGYSTPIRNVINYIQTHLENALTLDELAAQIDRNPKYLSSTFKREVGVGINEYINSARIQQSLTLLRNTDFVVSHIAMLVGFNDANYFTKVFSKEMGCTPSQYRKEYTT
ncbi:MAG: helix-turn-helix transcriptional regulator [Agathobacter sp.]|nr:helix-turn-helix transcriptional regulator [Agathobacter sp.]